MIDMVEVCYLVDAIWITCEVLLFLFEDGYIPRFALKVVSTTFLLVCFFHS